MEVALPVEFSRKRQVEVVRDYVRENFVLHIIFAGKGFLEREDKTYSVRAGQAFIIRPGAQALYRADRDDPWTYRWVGFHGPLCSKIVRNMGFSENEDVITLTDTERFAEYIDAMLDNKELNYSNHLRRNACLNLLLADIIDQAKVPEQYNKQSEEIYVDMAVEMIMANFSRNVSVAWIASEIGINRSYLSIIFKKRTGMSPQQYLISCRLERAAALLLETDMSIRAISASVGYSDPLTFSKAFKQNFGASPSIYRDNPPGLSHRAEKGEYEGKRKL